MLNVLGLSIGISASWIIYRMVAYEFSFDKKQPESEQIFQVVSRAKNLSFGDIHGFAGVSKGLLPFLLDDVSGLKSVVPMYFLHYESAKVNSNTDQELIVEGPEKQVNTLPAYFDMIGYTWLAGDPKTALTAPDQVVLTHSRAQRYFPNALPQEVLGKTIVYNDTLSISVSGVVADLDYPNSFDAQEFFAVSAEDIANNNWGMMSSDDLLYVKLEKGGTPEPVLEQLNATNTEHNKEFFEEYKYKTWYEFLPLAEKHFSAEFSAHTRVANKKVLFGLIGVAAFLLMLACINYINLSTAQMPQRTKEIGIRKTLGSTPAKLINRFLGETLMITILSILLSILLSFLALKIFSDFIPEGMQDFVDYKAIAIFGILLIAVVTLFAGIYPAWLITRVQTVNVLKGQTDKGISNGGFTLRRGLIVFQFVVAQVFIISAVIIGQQLRYTLSKDLGFNHETVLSIDIPFKIRNDERFKNKQFVMKEELKKYPEISAVALGDLPMSNYLISTICKYKSDTGVVQQQLNIKQIDVDYLNLYDIKLLAGRNLQKSDTTKEYVISEMAAKNFGFSTAQEAIGKYISFGDDSERLPIAGVVKDFHLFSLKTKIEGVAFVSNKESLNTINIKLPASSSKWESAIQIIENEWKKIYPGVPFEYSFYDDTIASLYEQERNTSKLVGVATGVTIFISCLGLFGLATLTAFQRKKEIGVRKVLGATVAAMVQMLSKDFVKLVLIAILIASPIAWWAMNKWLQDFAYHIEIQWWMFALAGMLAVMIALATVSFQAVKAAVANPVDSLRDE